MEQRPMLSHQLTASIQGSNFGVHRQHSMLSYQKNDDFVATLQGRQWFCRLQQTPFLRATSTQNDFGSPTFRRTYVFKHSSIHAHMCKDAIAHFLQPPRIQYIQMRGVRTDKFQTYAEKQEHTDRSRKNQCHCYVTQIQIGSKIQAVPHGSCGLSTHTHTRAHSHKQHKLYTLFCNPLLRRKALVHPAMYKNVRFRNTTYEANT